MGRKKHNLISIDVFPDNDPKQNPADKTLQFDQVTPNQVTPKKTSGETTLGWKPVRDPDGMIRYEPITAKREEQPSCCN
jgi:hypothetical protein